MRQDVRERARYSSLLPFLRVYKAGHRRRDENERRCEREVKVIPGDLQRGVVSLAVTLRGSQALPK